MHKTCYGCAKMIEDLLEIFIVTYDRPTYLDSTLKQLFNSPLRYCSVIILDNASDFETSEVIYKYRRENLHHLRHEKNIGGNANIARAFELCGSRPYTWVLCDDDNYNLDNVEELHTALTRGCDIIQVNSQISDIIFRQASFLPSFIFKSSLITNRIIQKMYDNISNMFPHLALHAELRNILYTVSKLDRNYVLCENSPNQSKDYNRDGENLKNISWFTGYSKAIQLIDCNDFRQFLVDECLKANGDGNLFNGILHEFFVNHYYHKSNGANTLHMWNIFDTKKRLLFILALLLMPLAFLFLVSNTVRGFSSYLHSKDVSHELYELTRKYLGKNVIFYGAGIYAKAFLDTADEVDFYLSQFNNVLFADHKFKQGELNAFNNHKIGVHPKDIMQHNPNVIIVLVYQDNQIKNYLNELGVNVKIEPMIKKSWLERLLGVRI